MSAFNLISLRTAKTLFNFGPSECSRIKEENLIMGQLTTFISPIALRKARIVYNFGLSERNRVKI